MSLPSNVPRHPQRRRLIQLLEEHPGASLQEIADHLNVARNAATHHVRALVARNLIVQVKQGRRRVHFLPDVKHETRRSLLSLVRQRTVRRVLENLQQDPEISWRSLAREIGIAPHSVRWHIKRLESEGLIHVLEADRGGHRVYVHPDVHEELGGARWTRGCEEPSGRLDPALV